VVPDASRWHGASHFLRPPFSQTSAFSSSPIFRPFHSFRLPLSPRTLWYPLCLPVLLSRTPMLSCLRSHLENTRPRRYALSRDLITINHAAPSDSPIHSLLSLSILSCIYPFDVRATSPAQAVDVSARAPFVLARPRLRSPRSLLCHSTTPRLVPHTRSHTHSHSPCHRRVPPSYRRLSSFRLLCVNNRRFTFFFFFFLPLLQACFLIPLCADYSSGCVSE